MLICLTAFQVGRERQMAFCFMQKFVDLQKIGTKVPIITAFALDHVRGFVFVEAEKACDVTEVHIFFYRKRKKCIRVGNDMPGDMYCFVEYKV